MANGPCPALAAGEHHRCTALRFRPFPNTIINLEKRRQVPGSDEVIGHAVLWISDDLYQQHRRRIGIPEQLEATPLNRKQQVRERERVVADVERPLDLWTQFQERLTPREWLRVLLHRRRQWRSECHPGS